MIISIAWRGVCTAACCGQEIAVVWFLLSKFPFPQLLQPENHPETEACPGDPRGIG
jgi:hypothetical protein